jgi:3-oxoadipate enol-lactonase
MSQLPPPDDLPQGFDHDFERGMRNRRAAMSDPFVDRAIGQSHAFNADFQNFITRYAWHGVWGRPGLDWKARRLIVLAITSALGRWEEFDGHLRGALTPGCSGALTPDEVREALIQFAIYAGVPAANTAFARATTILRELGHELAPRTADLATHTGVGRSVFTRSRPKLHATVREARSGATHHTIVLSHSLGLDGSMWDTLANELAAEHRVICPDTRGHGRSEIPSGALTIADLAEDAARLIDELYDGPVVWVGISMGGMIGQELALRHPGKVRALVLANTSSRYPEAGQQAMNERLSAVEAGGLQAVSAGSLQRFFSPAFHVAQPAAVARTQRLLEACDPDGFRACLAAVRDVHTADRLGQIAAPTLVITSTQDESTPPAMAEAIAQGIQGAQLVTLHGCAHLSALEQPAEFATAVRDFIDALR